MHSFTFHRDDLVPEEIKDEQMLEIFDKENKEMKYERGDKVRNRNNLKLIMYVHSIIRNAKNNNQVIGIKCYWWEI